MSTAVDIIRPMTCWIKFKTVLINRLHFWRIKNFFYIDDFFIWAAGKHSMLYSVSVDSDILMSAESIRQNCRLYKLIDCIHNLFFWFSSSWFRDTIWDENVHSMHNDPDWDETIMTSWCQLNQSDKTVDCTN